MKKTKIIADSACDLPKNLTQKYDIDVLPLTIIEDDAQYKDGIDITSEEVIKRLRNDAYLTTSQVTMNQYYQKFEEYLLQDIECIYPAFSSKLSGSYQASIIAREQLSEKYGDKIDTIHIIDTKCASLGIGLIVIKAAIMASEGKNTDEILNHVEENSDNMDHIFSVFDLKYLHRGGRLNKGAAVLGNLFNVYPILTVKDGNLELLETVRGQKKHFKRMMELIDSRGSNFDKQTIGIVHGDEKNIEVAEEIKSVFRETYGTKEFISTYIGGVISAHTGPDVYSIFFLKKPNN